MDYILFVFFILEPLIFFGPLAAFHFLLIIFMLVFI